MTISVPRLILVTNRETTKIPLAEVAKRAIAGGVDVVQVREKDLEEPALLRLCEDVVHAVGDSSRVMVNGSVSVAKKLDIGLHLPEFARRPSEIDFNELGLVGRSVHSPEAAAESTWTDFVIAGHVFATASKSRQSPLGWTGLASIVRRSPVPVIAIGGMTPSRVAEIIESGASGIAVLSGINDDTDPESAAKAFKQRLENDVTDTQTHIDVTVNGKKATIACGLSVLDYLTQRGFHERMVVVELNGVILKKNAFAATQISAGDKIEIVHFVGGG
jgi:thiamine biosynthesis protein ThiS